MDIKIKGISLEILTKALAQAREGRLFILDKMLACISAPRDHISQYAPKILQLVIPADRIGELIGPGGKNIKAIIEASGAEIDIEEDDEKKVGQVNIASADQEAIDRAKNLIEAMMHVDQVGDEYDGKVTRIESYGCFVEYGYKKEGLVHVSAMSTSYLDDPHKVVKLGDIVHVRVSAIQDDGKVKMSMLTPEQEAQARGSAGSRRRPDFKGGKRRDNNRDRQRRSFSDNRTHRPDFHDANVGSN